MISLYCKSMGKIFKVWHVAKTEDDANIFMEKNRDTGVIAVNDGLIYIADIYGITVSSKVLPD